MSTRGVTKVIGLCLYVLNRTRLRIHLPIKTKVGYGLYIGHDGPLIVNPTTIIGNNCSLSQFVTIGSNEGHAAIIRG